MNRQNGFTLLEIMIAVAILVGGILGILALFPVALNSAKNTIETTYSVLIAQSVEQAIRESIAHRKGQTKDGKWTYFMFQHSGVKDPLPRDIASADPTADYFILLPEDDSNDKLRSVNRIQAYQDAHTYVYPESDGFEEWEEGEGDQLHFVSENEYQDSSASPNGGGNPLKADNDGDDYEYTINNPVTGEELTDSTYEVFRTYRLDQSFFPIDEDADEEFNDGSDEQNDPIRLYSFAFAIRRALNDASLERPHASRFIPAGELFEVEILVFKSFRANTSMSLNPIYRTTFLLHK